jgi:signal transduction histidine kinase
MSTASDDTLAFGRQLSESNLAAARLGAGIAALAMPAGVTLDMVSHPEKVGLFLVIRLVASAFNLGVFFMARVPFFRRNSEWLGISIFAICELGVLAMISVIEGGYASPYYAGLNATILATCLLFTWPWSTTAVLCGCTVALWSAPAVAEAARGTLDTSAFGNNVYFLILTSALAVATSAVRYSLARKEFDSRTALAKTSSELSETLERLRELDRFKSEFFANITHELKTPLTMILTPLELMLQGELGRLSDAQRASSQSMLRSGMKLAKLIEDLLDLSKLDESRLRLRIREQDLVSYLKELVALLQPLVQRKSIDLIFESDVPSCMVFCDIDRLERVFVNLLSNAAKFTPLKGEIHVTLRDTGKSATISVADNGVGFPPERAEQLFERFFQVDMTGTRKFGGTGIGLSLARELVRLHAGTINAESAPGRGATFTVLLPKGAVHIDPEHIDRRSQRADRVGGSRAEDQGIGEWQLETRGQFRFIDVDEATNQRIVDRDEDELSRDQSVLVVEDTPDVIRMIHLTLRGRFRVFAAPGGEKGLELARKHLPSLIITDLMMPDVDGMELTRKLRADPTTRHIPIVMLTARGDVEDRVAGLEAGVNAYLTKPFSTRELFSTVRGLVRIQERTAELALSHNMDSLETVAGGLAHEINNPLNYIKNALDVIQRDYSASLKSLREGTGVPDSRPGGAPMSLRMERMFEVAETGVKRIAATVSLMQRYSREGFTRVPQPVDVFDAARDVASVLQTGMSTLLIGTSFQGDGTVECVPEEMNQVLTNLIQNALDAIRRDGTGWVRVSGKVEGDMVVLSVEDNGAGVKPEDRAKIFTPFFTTKEVGVGMGLGLTIVHRVVRSLGGTVSVNSQVGAGTEFVIRLPREPRATPGLLQAVSEGASAT